MTLLSLLSFCLGGFSYIILRAGMTMNRHRAEYDARLEAKKAIRRRERTVEFHSKKNSRMAFATRTHADFGVDVETARAKLVRENEIRLRGFEAYQECPSCGQYGFWLIEQICSPWDLERICGACEHIWLQKK